MSSKTITADLAAEFKKILTRLDSEHNLTNVRLKEAPKKANEADLWVLAKMVEVLFEKLENAQAEVLSLREEIKGMKIIFMDK